MTFDEMCEFDVLYEAYKAARRGKRSKYSEAQYEANVLQLTERLSYILRSGKYHPSKFEVFYVREPKLRLVQAPAFVDKVVQQPLSITSFTKPSRAASYKTTTRASLAKEHTTACLD